VAIAPGTKQACGSSIMSCNESVAPVRAVTVPGTGILMLSVQSVTSGVPALFVPPPVNGCAQLLLPVTPPSDPNAWASTLDAFIPPRSSPPTTREITKAPDNPSRFARFKAPPPIDAPRLVVAHQLSPAVISRGREPSRLLSYRTESTDIPPDYVDQWQLGSEHSSPAYGDPAILG
jgi:hypothetical protein